LTLRLVYGRGLRGRIVGGRSIVLPGCCWGTGAVCAALTSATGGAACYFSAVVPAARVAGAAAVEGLTHFRAGGLRGGDGSAIEVGCCEEGADLLGVNGRDKEGEQKDEADAEEVESEVGGGCHWRSCR